MKTKITVNDVGTAYIPKDLREDGLNGEIDAYIAPFMLVMVNPQTSLETLEQSLLTILQELKQRKIELAKT